MDRDQNDKGFEVKPGTAIGYSIVADLGGHRQMTVQCFVGEDEPDEEINRRIDKVFRVLDRQKAKYDLDKLEAEFEEAARHLRNFLNAIPMAEKEAQYRLAVLKVELQGMVDGRREYFNEEAAKHVATHRKGEFVPRGAVESRLRAMDSEIEKKQAAIAANPADADQGRQIAVNNIYAKQDDLKKRRAAINDLRKMAGMDAHTFMAGIENEDPLGATETKGA